MLIPGVAAQTSAGHQRTVNEDNHWVSPDCRLFVVADGLGGAVGGAIASRLAVETVEALFKATPPPTKDGAIGAWLADAVSQVNAEIWNASERESGLRGMGTTIVVAVHSSDDRMTIAHVGDSRACLVRVGNLVQLTEDHTVVQDMVREGRMTPEEALVNPYKNLLTRCLGHDDCVEVDRTSVELQANDWIVLFTDGLTTVLWDRDIVEILQSVADPKRACEELIWHTLEGGAPDNVTVIAILFSGPTEGVAA